MHIFRWLMTHPIVTAWILAALAILLNLNMGTKSDHGEAVHYEKVTHEVVESEKPSVSHESGAESQADAASNEADNKETTRKQAASLEAGLVVNEESSNTSETDVSKSKNSSTDQAVVVAVASVQASAETDTSEASVVDASMTKETTSTTSSTRSSNEQVGGEQVKAEGLASMKTEQLIQLAREAFWQGDKEKSVAIYQALIEREPTLLALKGELANVYWHQEKQKESAALYAEIAVPMVKAGKAKEVSNMLGFIGVFFPEKAKELQNLISQ